MWHAQDAVSLDPTPDAVKYKQTYDAQPVNKKRRDNVLTFSHGPINGPTKTCLFKYNCPHSHLPIIWMRKYHPTNFVSCCADTIQ